MPLLIAPARLSRVAAMCRVAFIVTVAVSYSAFSSPAFASDVTVASPLNGSHVTSPVWVRAHNIGCDSVPPSAFAYSIDSSTALITGETPFDIDVAKQTLAAGAHTIHFKSWTARGACPVVNTQFVVGSATSTASTATTTDTSSYGMPANAASSGDLDGKAGWQQIHDGGTPGESRGSTVYPASTPLYDDGRKFYMTYTDHAGERWSVNADKDGSSTYFVLDTYVYLPNPSEVLNLEMDINQVTSNGETIILGTQCAATTGTWEAGFTSGKYDHWWSSSIKCNPRQWKANTWHHVQVGMHRSSSGTVTHDWVNLDGEHHVWGYTHESAHYLGWEPGIIDVQFQIEGANAGSGSVTSYIHKMTVYRW